MGDRVHYALDKKLLKKQDWKDKDEIVQQPLNKQRIQLFNVSLNNRLKRTEDYEDWEDINWFDHEQRALKKLERRYGKKNSTAKKKALRRFNKGRTFEEEIHKKVADFNKEATKELKNKLLQQEKFLLQQLKDIRSQLKHLHKPNRQQKYKRQKKF